MVERKCGLCDREVDYLVRVDVGLNYQYDNVFPDIDEWCLLCLFDKIEDQRTDKKLFTEWRKAYYGDE